MPIKGLSDRPARFPQLGTLHKGAPKTGNAPGKDLSYFRFVAAPGYPNLQAVFERVYGKEPKRIKVYLPFQTGDENASSWNEEWVKGGLVTRCDGEHVVMERVDNKMVQYTENAPACRKGKCHCKPTMRMGLILKDLVEATGFFGYVLLQSTSTLDVMEINSNLRAAESLMQLRGISFVLSRAEREVSVTINGERKRVKKSLLHLEPDPQWVQAKMIGSVENLTALPSGNAPALPPPPDTEDAADETDSEIMDGEYTPVEPEKQAATESKDKASEPASVLHIHVADDTVTFLNKLAVATFKARIAKYEADKGASFELAHSDITDAVSWANVEDSAAKWAGASADGMVGYSITPDVEKSLTEVVVVGKQYPLTRNDEVRPHLRKLKEAAITEITEWVNGQLAQSALEGKSVFVMIEPKNILALYSVKKWGELAEKLQLGEIVDRFTYL